MIPVIPVRYLLLAALLAGFGGGWVVQGWRWDAAKAEELVALEKKRADEATAATEAETLRAMIEKEIRDMQMRLTHEIRKDAYRCAVPDDGVRLFNDSRTGGHAGEPARPVP
jgi:hypothetical protein